MKHLKSSLRDLRQIFERSLVARDLAEPLASFDDSHPVENVCSFMNEKEYDVVGIRCKGQMAGYCDRSAVTGPTIGDHLIKFENSVVLDEVAPIVEVLRSLVEAPRVFVASGDRVWGIVTRGDLQKAPMRMCLFGLISLLEMQLLRLIKVAYPDGSWQPMISPPRVEGAEKILRDRIDRNEGTELCDCLQFADKSTIIAKSESLRLRLGFESRTNTESLLKELERLRDDLAHAQDILAGRWPRIVELASLAETLLMRCEKSDASEDRPA